MMSGICRTGAGDSSRRAVSNMLKRRARLSTCRHPSINDLMKSGGGLGRMRRALRAVHDGGSRLAGVGVKAGTFFQSTRLAASIRLEIARKSPRSCLIWRLGARATMRRKWARKYGPPRSESCSRCPLTRMNNHSSQCQEKKRRKCH